MFTAKTLKTDSKLRKKNHFKVNINKRNVKPRIWIMKMYDPNEDDHSYMDMGMLPNMYSN
jgi:hypothetical protein